MQLALPVSRSAASAWAPASSGGLGRDPDALLRAAARPGAGIVPAVALRRGPAQRRPGRPGSWAGSACARAADLEGELGAGSSPLENPEARRAFLSTVRGLIDLHGERVKRRRSSCTLTAAMPTLIVRRARRYPLTPVRHGREAHASHARQPAPRRPPNTPGHFPHRDEPRRFATTLLDFVALDRADAGRPTAAAGEVCRPGRRRGARATRPTRRSGSA